MLIATLSPPTQAPAPAIAWLSLRVVELSVSDAPNPPMPPP